MPVTTELRLELLTRTGQGFSKREMVNYCKDRYRVSDTYIYQLLKKMPQWTRGLLSLEEERKAYVDMLARLYAMDYKQFIAIEKETETKTRDRLTNTRLLILDKISLLRKFYEKEDPTAANATLVKLREERVTDSLRIYEASVVAEVDRKNQEVREVKIDDGQETA